MNTGSPEHQAHCWGANNRIDVDYTQTHAMVSLGKSGESLKSATPCAHVIIRRVDLPVFLGTLRALLNAPRPESWPDEHRVFGQFETDGAIWHLVRDLCEGAWTLYIGLEGKRHQVMLAFGDTEVREMLANEDVQAPAVN